MVLSYNYPKQKKAAVTNKCTSIAGHFNGHVEALKQFMWHHPMWDVEGRIGSHWTPPSGDYSLRIAPTDARTTINHTTMNKYTYFAVRFDGHCNAMTQRQWMTTATTAALSRNDAGRGGKLLTRPGGQNTRPPVVAYQHRCTRSK